jgi:hypothetical protein
MHYWARPHRALLVMVAATALGCGGGDSSAADGGGDSGPAPQGRDAGALDTGSVGQPDAFASDAGPHPGDSGHAGDAAMQGDAPSGPPDGGAIALPRPSAASVSDAIAAGLSSYHRNASTGDIWCLPCDGAPVMLAAAAYAGDTSVDARLLEQMRNLLSGGNDPFATGGYAANDERNATAMYAIAKLVPRIWSQLSAAEVHTIDLIMEATLVASAYTTADATNANGAPLSIEGSNDPNRDFNPNYREGMIGAVLVGTEYFGGQQATTALLQAFDDVAFAAELQANGLTNAYWTFGTYMTNASAPQPQAIQQGIQGYAMHGMTLGQLMNIYLYLVSDTFGATVACGLNGGAGILVGSVYAGRIVSGCSGLPNLGAVGMEKEFDSVDGNGPRSDAGYVRLGLRTNLMNQLVLLLYGDWQATAASMTALQQVGIGVKDFFYKATQGYESYSHGTDEGLFTCASMDCPLNQAIWTELLAPAHGL